jgi:hypothetical protein
MAWPAVKQEFTQEHFRRYVAGLSWPAWRPSKIVWHNTAAPSLAQWMKSAAEDRAKGLVPGITRIRNLERYFRDQNGWSGCPHLFIANDFTWVMNPLTAAGVHSPSFNTTAIGIEMVGDFDREDDDAGEGLKVKQNTIFATAVLCSALGLDPASAIYLHKQDPRTTHDCPGKDIASDKFQMIAEVVDLMSGGEHDPAEVAAVIETGTAPKIPAMEGRGITTANNLNFRRGPGVDNESTGSLPKGIELTILATARNGSTEWLQVRTPAGHTGWVSGRYVQIS